MNSSESLQRGIVSTWNADSSLSPVNGPYFVRADEKVDYPYSVFDLEADRENVFGGNYETYTVQFNVYSDNKSSEEINDIAENIYNEYDYTIMTLAGGYKSGKMVRQESEIVISDKNNWQLVVIYLVNIS
jgi:hypothetical protein